MRAIGVLIPHQPHHGWCWFILSHSSSTTTSPSPPQFDPYHTQPPSREPLPYVEGCELKNAPQPPQKRGRRHICPSPFQRDVGSASSLDGGTGEVERQGGTQEMGGPTGTSHERSTMKVVLRFHQSLSPPSSH
jgi:hypothetical protein